MYTNLSTYILVMKCLKDWQNLNLFILIVSSSITTNSKLYYLFKMYIFSEEPAQTLSSDCEISGQGRCGAVGNSQRSAWPS